MSKLFAIWRSCLLVRLAAVLVLAPVTYGDAGQRQGVSDGGRLVERSRQRPVAVPQLLSTQSQRSIG